MNASRQKSAKYPRLRRIGTFRMNVQEQIGEYIASQPEPKRTDLQELHRIILEVKPACKLWFLDGRNSEGKIVSNPNIGYGFYTITYADGTTRDFYQIGLSANKTGISVYIMGIEDKKYLAEAYGKQLGKASVTGYCIRFKTLRDINTEILGAAIRYGFETQKVKTNT
jgi:Domain of unknown function (DU1801)